ncbi:LPS export ABC transporter permease LptG [Pontivivens ytuae]|uniref:LPS export ABC transporter permease LptG n=1 Tax=Pontivivens ytuae TaxID=2789856 RepID=A0A7S9LRQ0_9RHOB|nr:LPS export ABC transporter permease LptG [Pontivivens ytuae]QPH53906.1 LPS export ABC transporter permease LptG [Pontivivens ytuae]
MIATLPAYILRRLFTGIGVAFLVAFVLVMMGDLLDLSTEEGDAPLLALALLHAPSVLTETLPFVVLLGALAAFLRLARTSELVVTRAAGVSVWRLLRIPMIAAMLLGVLSFTVWNPMAAASLARYEVLSSRYFDGRESLLSISAEGLWLRQASEQGQTVINATRATPEGEELIGVSIFEFNEDNNLSRRISARRALLQDGYWEVEAARVWDIAPTARGQTITARDEDRLELPTDLTSNRILESFADPEALSFWELGSFIETLDASGFSSVRHRMHLQTQLAQPVLFAAMVLIAAGFAMRHVRFGSIGVRVMLCVMSGFAIFFLSDFTQALGAAGTIPVLLAAWVPPIAALLLATALLLHLEDG